MAAGISVRCDVELTDAGPESPRGNIYIPFRHGQNWKRIILVQHLDFDGCDAHASDRPRSLVQITHGVLAYYRRALIRMEAIGGYPTSLPLCEAPSRRFPVRPDKCMAVEADGHHGRSHDGGSICEGGSLCYQGCRRAYSNIMHSRGGHRDISLD